MLKCMTEQSADLLVLEENTETAILDTGCARKASSPKGEAEAVRKEENGEEKIRRKSNR